MPSTLAPLTFAPLLVEAALRALVAALAVWACLRFLRVGNVLVQKTAWGLILLASLAQPFAPRWQLLPASAALRLPALLPTAHSSSAMLHAATAPQPAPSVSPNATDPQLKGTGFSPYIDPATTRALQAADKAGALKGHGFSRAAEPHSKIAALAAEGIPVVEESIPSGAKAQHSFLRIGGTAEAVPFQSAPIHYRKSSSAASLAPEAPPSPPKTTTPAALAWLLYLGVFAALLLRLLIGLISALRLWFTAAPIATPGVRWSPRVASPVNIGSGIVLPANYAAWDQEKLRIVLAHERSHIRQGDFYLQLLAALYAALFWFSPLGWWLKRKLSELGEAISDRAALQQAASPSAYAQLLLEFAALPRPTLTGVAMARSSHLAQRIDRLLNESRFRHSFAAGGRRALLAVLLVPAALVASTALVRVQAQPAAQSSGQSTPQQITDQSNDQNATPATTPASPAAPQAAQPPAPPSPPDSFSVPAPVRAPEPAAVPVPPAPRAIVVLPNPPAPPDPQAAPAPPLPPDPPASFTLRSPGNRIFIDNDDLSLTIDPAQIRETIRGAIDGEPGFFYFTNEQPYAVVGDPGTHVRFSGGWDGDRVQDVEKARKIAHGHFLLFQHEGKTYLIDDPAVVAQVEEMNKPLAAMDEQMRALAKQEREFGQQQREAARQMREATIQTPDLSKEIAALNAAVASLQAKQGTTITQKDLGELQRQIGQIQGRLGALQGKIEIQHFNIDGNMGKFGEQQGKIGGEMGKLGAQIGETARENDAKIKAIITGSLANGKARPVE